MKNEVPKIFNKHNLNIISISTLEGFKLVQLDSILYMLAENCYTTIVLEGNVKIMSSKNLGYYDRIFFGEFAFVRIHHSIIVNLLKVSSFIRTGGGQVVIATEKKLPVSRARKSFLLSVLKQLNI